MCPVAVVTRDHELPKSVLVKSLEVLEVWSPRWVLGAKVKVFLLEAPRAESMPVLLPASGGTPIPWLVGLPLPSKCVAPTSASVIPSPPDS